MVLGYGSCGKEARQRGSIITSNFILYNKNNGIENSSIWNNDNQKLTKEIENH